MKSWTMGWALLLAALLLVCGWALAEEETDNLDVFNKAFMQENGLCDENGQRLYLQDMDWDGDLCYAYLTDWCVYTYTPGGEVQKLCALPEAPEGFFYDPESMSEEETEQLGGTVTYITAWEGALYGCNVYSGRWGVIDEEGVHWEESRLNFSCLFMRIPSFRIGLWPGSWRRMRCMCWPTRETSMTNMSMRCLRLTWRRARASGMIMTACWAACAGIRIRLRTG